MAQDIKLGELPVYAWVYVGLYADGDGLSGYTNGLAYFGKPEIEVLQTQNSAEDLYGFLYDISRYVIENNVTLNDGETIGFSAEQKLASACRRASPPKIPALKSITDVLFHHKYKRSARNQTRRPFCLIKPFYELALILGR